MNERAILLRRVQVAGFAMQEAKLFLDTHPGDGEALAYFKKYRDMAREAAAAYTAVYGPLRPEDTQGAVWNWVDGPWPWELEANL